MPISPISGHMPLSQMQASQHTAASPLLEQGNRLFEQSVRAVCSTRSSALPKFGSQTVDYRTASVAECPQ